MRTEEAQKRGVDDGCYDTYIMDMNTSTYQSGEPATPGSYGEAPAGFRLPDDTRLGRVRLRVSDLTRSLSFYEEFLGFRVLRKGEGFAELGARDDDRVLVELNEQRGISAAAQRGRLGLYHFAILLPDRGSLGRFIFYAGKLGVRLGSADHLVSEALYLRDPDGLGIEIYADRPRDTWRRVGREILMAADPLDLQGLLSEAGDGNWPGMPAGTVIGHAHLHVGDLQQARTFYSDAVGFDVMTASYPGALFLGAGGYHHHLGTNVWAGDGARPTRADEAGLIEWTIELPDRASVAAAADSISAAGYAVTRANDEAVTTDPWGTAVRLRIS